MILITFFINFELFLRVYIQDKIDIHLMPSDIIDVPYVQINLSELNISKDKPRILIIGDYISIHNSFEKQKTYPQILDSKLNNSFEIINTGAVYYSIPEEINLLKNKGLDFNPDLIVVGYIVNDIDLENPLNGIRNLKIKENLHKFKILSSTILKEIYFQNYRMKKYFRLISNNNPYFPNRYYNLYDNLKYNNIYQNFLSELKEIQDQRDIPIIFVSIPLFYNNFEDEKINSINDIIYQSCLEKGLTCIDMLDIFKDYELLEIKEDDGDIWHPNELGLELIADEIYKSVIGMDQYKKDF